MEVSIVALCVKNLPYLIKTVQKSANLIKKWFILGFGFSFKFLILIYRKKYQPKHLLWHLL
jgi:hypothetical protein